MFLIIPILPLSETSHNIHSIILELMHTFLCAVPAK